jgi:translation elongation factor EF-Tu-like GTPase
MDPVYLFTVEDTFQISGRGCVLVPGPSAEEGSQRIRIGDRVCLRKPDGCSFDTTIAGVEMIGHRSRPKVITAPILLPGDVTKGDVPIGTEVWLLP